MVSIIGFKAYGACTETTCTDPSTCRYVSQGSDLVLSSNDNNTTVCVQGGSSAYGKVDFTGTTGITLECEADDRSCILNGNNSGSVVTFKGESDANITNKNACEDEDGYWDEKDTPDNLEDDVCYIGVTSATILSGFTITGGAGTNYANGCAWADELCGAGIFISNGSHPTLENLALVQKHFIFSVTNQFYKL